MVGSRASSSAKDGAGRFHGLRRALDDVANAHFEGTKISRRGGVHGALKAAFVVGWFVASYLALVFLVSSWWQAVLVGVSMSAAATAIGFVVVHDANHGALCESHLGNRAWSALFDVMGISSHVWRRSHNVDHHARPNVDGADPDIDFGSLARLAPSQAWRWWHRYQHLYLFPLYGFAYPRWVLIEDFARVARGRIGSKPLRRPKGREAVLFFAGKLAFVGWAIALPSFYHPVWKVLLVALACGYLVGLALALTVSLGHSVEGISFSELTPANADEWCAHQIEASCDFGTRNAALTWYTGALNFQVTHHLFPRISHVHYVALSPLVEKVCDDFGVRRITHPSFFAALGAHRRLLRSLGAGAPSRRSVAGFEEASSPLLSAVSGAPTSTHQ